VANTANPDNVAFAFIESTRDALTQWQVVDQALTPQAPLAVRRRAASDAALGLAVSWETFISDWLVAAINREPSQYIANLTARVKNTVVTEGIVPEEALSEQLLSVSRLNMSSIRSIIAPDGANVAIPDYRSLRSKSQRWLTPTYRTRIDNINGRTYAPIRPLRLIRNILSHHSPQSLDAARGYLDNPEVPEAYRRATQHGQGVAGWRRYIYADNHINQFHDDVIAVATILATPAT
jgi:hypothetical protein